MMKKRLTNLLNNYIAEWESFPVPLFVFSLLPLVVLVLSIPLTNLLAIFLPELIATAITVTLLFCLIGVTGIMIAYYKVFPQPFYMVRGAPAMVTGILLAIFGFGFAAWGLLYNFTPFFNP